MTLWLAVGDEAGGWDAIGHGRDRDWLGAALVLAPEPIWRGLDRDKAGDGRSIRERLGNPLHSLPPQYLQSAGDRRHHVLPALNYLRERGLAGDWRLAAPPADPVAAELADNLRWLAFHRRLLTLGAHGTAAQLRRLHDSGDPAQVLGSLYGWLAALILPFLPAGDRLLVCPDSRSESATGNPAWERAGYRPAPTAGERLPTDRRGLSSQVLDSARQRLRQHWPEAGEALDCGTLDWLRKQSGLGFVPLDAANAVADLGATLLSMVHKPGYTLKLDAQDLNGGRARFYSLRELTGN